MSTLGQLYPQNISSSTCFINLTHSLFTTKEHIRKYIRNDFSNLVGFEDVTSNLVGFSNVVMILSSHTPDHDQDEQVLDCLCEDCLR